MNSNSLTTPPRSNFFEKPEIEITEGEVLLFCTLKNEVQRIPYFLDFYREKGINHFFVIDNASTDGSRNILEQQPDVHLFETAMSYKGSSAGRLWMQELALHYGLGRWCLTVDVDELLVWPAAEWLSIPQLCNYLDVDGSDGLLCVFLDMYSDKPLGHTIYTPGQPFTEVCQWFETDSYVLRPGGNPPFLSIFGGPRGKSLLEKERGSNGPMMKKVPLVKWHAEFTYIFSTHSHSYLTLSRLTGALLHFKFFDFFTELAAREHARGDRRQTKDYAHYAASMTEGICFHGPQSLKYKHPADLVELGVLAVPEDYRSWVASVLGVPIIDDIDRKNPDHFSQIEMGMADRRNELLAELLPHPARVAPPEGSRDFTIREPGAVWPFVRNPKLVEYFVDGIPQSMLHENRQRFVMRARQLVQFLDADPEGVFVGLPEMVIYQFRDPQLQLLCFVEGNLLWQKPLSGNSPDLSVALHSLRPMTYRIAHSWQIPAGGMFRDVSFYVAGNEHVPDGAARLEDFEVGLLGEPLITLPAITFAKEGLVSIGMDGVVDRLFEGRINGWLYSGATSSWHHPVAIYVDGQFVSSIVANQARPDLDKSLETGSGFAELLPLGYFYEQGRRCITLDVRVAGTGVSLRRMPLRLDGEKSYYWSDDGWRAGQPSPVKLPLWYRAARNIKRKLMASFFET